MKILIVDDIASNRKLLRLQLEAEGFDVVEAADGIDALEVLSRETVDAVLSDILMPRMATDCAMRYARTRSSVP